MERSFFRDFNRLAELVLSYRAAKPMLVALHYDLFTWIRRGYDEPARLARRLGLDAEVLRRVLDAICALGWLRKRAGSYRNTRAGNRLLTSSSREYVGHSLKYQEYTWDAWSQLREVLQTGQPRARLRDWIAKDFFTTDYIKAMGEVTRHPAWELAGKLDWSGIEQVLDVGSGAGTFSAAFVERAGAVRVTLFDLPAPLHVARGLLRRHPHRRRLSFKPANYLTDSLGRDEYDLVLISNVTRVEDEKTNRLLVRKAWRALRPGGRLVIHDFTIEPSRTAPLFSALLSVHVLLFAGRGAAYTEREYVGWLRDAGFGAIERIRVATRSLHPSCAIVGRRAPA